MPSINQWFDQKSGRKTSRIQIGIWNSAHILGADDFRYCVWWCSQKTSTIHSQNIVFYPGKFFNVKMHRIIEIYSSLCVKVCQNWLWKFWRCQAKLIRRIWAQSILVWFSQYVSYFVGWIVNIVHGKLNKQALVSILFSILFSLQKLRRLPVLFLKKKVAFEI